MANEFHFFKFSQFIKSRQIKKEMSELQKERELNELVKLQQRNAMSSEEDEQLEKSCGIQYQLKPNHPNSRPQSGFRKPIKNPFSDHSDNSSDDSFNQQQKKGNGTNISTSSPFLPPKQPKIKSVLQEAQSTMKWNRDEENQIQILSKLQGQNMKDKKIRELAGKYKTLNIAYEKEKTMRKNMQNQLNAQLRISSSKDNQASSSQEKRPNSKGRSNSNNYSKNNDNEKSLLSSTSKISNSNEKCGNPQCQQNQKKVMQFRLQCQNLKSELNKAVRVITREIGENFNIDQALSQDNAWKGRQQKIEKLRSRVKQLEQKLSNNGVEISRVSGFTQATTTNPANFNATSMSRASSTLAQNKRKQLENLKIQVDTLKSDNQLLQGKVKSITARKLNVESELKELKADFEKKKLILIEKSQNDDKFISLLKCQNEKLKKDQRVVTKVVYKDQKDNEQISKLQKQIERLKSQLMIKSKNQQEKCLDSNKNAQSDQKIEIMFPSSQKSRKSIQKSSNSKINTDSINPPSKKLINSSNQEISVEKKKQIQNQHLKGNKYLKKMTAEEEADIYQNWKAKKQ